MTSQLKHIWATFQSKDKADALFLHKKVREGDNMAMRGLIILWNRHGAKYSGEMNMLCPKCISKTIMYFNDIAKYENSKNWYRAKRGVCGTLNGTLRAKVQARRYAAVRK